MADTREKEAAELDDSEIWMTIISKFALLDMPIEPKIEMMMQATGDKEIVVKALEACVANHLIQQSQADEIIEQLG